MSDRLADTINDTAARLGISRSLLYNEIKEGRLVALKARGRTIISRAEQERWMASLATMPGIETPEETRRGTIEKRHDCPDAKPAPARGDISMVNAALNATGIYFLYRGDVCVYVGKSTNILARVANHATNPRKAFDSFSYIECPATRLDQLECHYITKLKPEMNNCSLSRGLRGLPARPRYDMATGKWMDR